MKEAMQSVWIGIWSLIEGGGDGLKMKKWEKLQGGVGKACFSILHDHAKRSSKTKMQLMDFPLCTIMRNC